MNFQSLSNLNWQDRRRMVAGLEEKSPAEVEQFFLQLVLQHNDDPAGLSAALQIIREQRGAVYADLSRLLDQPESQARRFGALALGLLGDSQAIPPLLGALHDPDANVRFNVIEALGRLRAAEAVQPLLSVLRAGSYFDRFAAMNALAEIGDPAAGPELVRFLSDPALAEAAARGLARLGGPEVTAAITGWLNREGAAAITAAGALDSLAQRWPERADAIKKEFFERLSPSGRANLLEAVPGPGPADEEREAGSEAAPARMAAVLGWLLERNPQDVQVRAALVGLLRTSLSADAAARALASCDGALDELIAPEVGLEPDARDALLRAAAANPGRGCTQIFVQGLGAEDEQTAALCAGALGALADPQALDAILAHLEHPSARVRHLLVQAVVNTPAAGRVERLAELVGSAHPEVRRAALEGLGALAEPGSAGVVLAALQDPDAAVRAGALLALPGFDLPERFRILENAARDPSATIRAAAVRALGSLAGPVDASVLAALHGALNDPEFWTRLYACRSLRALAQYAGPASLPHLEKLMNDPLPPVRQAAIDAMVAIRDSMEAGRTP